ncbi:type II toxin-antitoxin system RelE/ParE family toxin [Mycobacterium sp. smrl_JER01]|uniref:type II toxin-antitoxin system RelE/ParE family toxin n=1 Tax=Mycobacterium sp. smrl_JER01 TaxID=3402633 RepID=UPI003AC2CD46
MNRFVLSPAAQADLEQIWDYTCDLWNDDQAESYIREIQRGIELVADNPLIGRSCEEVRPGYRRHRVGSQTLYYRVGASDLIVVVRVLHQSMDVDQNLD